MWGCPAPEFAKDEKVVQFAREVVERARNLPGVQSAALTSVLPVSCNCNTDWVRFVGRPYNGIHNEVNEREVTPEFFTTLHARLRAGRFFTDDDDASKPQVVLINEAFARGISRGKIRLAKKWGTRS